jgi:predicted PurR-regulated permease PerM
MFSLDDRAGNVLTTVALFAAIASVLYLARVVLFVLLLSLLFAYLLEPAVVLVQQHSWLARKNRTWAIAQVYLIGILTFGCLALASGSHLAAQTGKVKAGFLGVLDTLSTGRTGAGLGSRHFLSAAQQSWIQQLVARYHDLIVRITERSATAAAYIASRAMWLLAVPVLAIFFLLDGRQIADAVLEAVEAKGDQTRTARILRQVDGMLAQYVRAQLALAGLSFVFYSVSMLVLRFPYAIALGFLGGVLEFLPTVGWIASGVIILTIGYMTHSHWIWMAGLLIVWRLVQDYVNSPRIMGKSLKLPALIVVCALMVGGEIGGIAGMYLSIPAVALLRIVWLECFSTGKFAKVREFTRTQGAHGQAVQDFSKS